MGKRWSKEDLDRLVAMWNAGEKATVIAAHLGRTLYAVMHKKEALVDAGVIRNRRICVLVPTQFDGLIKQMRMDGRTMKEMAAASGLTVYQVKNRIEWMRRRNVPGIDNFNFNRKRLCSFADVADAVSDKYRKPVAVIISLSRKAKTIEARQVLMAVGYKYSGLSLPQIGQKCNRDHTTVLHATRVAPVKYPQAVSEIEARLLHREAAE